MGSFVIKSGCHYTLRHSSLTISQRSKRDIIKIAAKIFGVTFGFRRKERNRFVEAGTCKGSSS